MAAEAHRLPLHACKDATAAPPKRAFVRLSSRSAAYNSKRSFAGQSPGQRSIEEMIFFRRRIRPCGPHPEVALHTSTPPVREARRNSDDAMKRSRPLADQELSETLKYSLEDTTERSPKRRHPCVASEEEVDSQDAQKTSGQNWWLACALALDHVVSTEGTIYGDSSFGIIKTAAHHRCSAYVALLQGPEAVYIPEVVNPTQAASWFGA